MSTIEAARPVVLFSYSLYQRKDEKSMTATIQTVRTNAVFDDWPANRVNEKGRKAPHLLYPQLLDDSNPRERQAGLDMGLAMLPRCDELWCYGDRSSHGIHLEIEEAVWLGIPVRRVTEQENGFVIGRVKNTVPAEAPIQAMRMV